MAGAGSIIGALRGVEGVLPLLPCQSHHRRSDRIVGHVQLCWLALLPIRTIENQVGDTWRNISHELDRMLLITLETASGTVSQRTRTTARQRQILDKLGLADPPCYFEFATTGD